MELKIILLSALRYDNKNGKGTRLSYIFAENSAISDTDKMKGYQEFAIFVNYDVFDKLPIEKMGKQCTIKTEEVPSKNNPLKKVTRVIQIDNISLV